MGGGIEVTSEPGKGSVFTLELALSTLAVAGAAAAPAPQAGAPLAASPPLAAGQRDVLYIEDNQPNIALMRALIARRPGWRLRVGRTGGEGLRLARELRPDLILLDLHLPDQGGEQVIEALRADAGLREVPFAILSADALPATIERLRASGAADYLTKPLDLPRMLALLDRFAA